MSNTKNLYDKDYFENGIKTGKSCYENYRWLPELTVPMAKVIIDKLSIKKEHKILDFGCAKGTLVKALQELGYCCEGVNCSEYAINNAVCGDCYLIESPQEIEEGYDYIIAKDVFEHLEDPLETLEILSAKSKGIFIVVPLGENGKYFDRRNNKDKTHITCERIDYWVNLLLKVCKRGAWCHSIPGIKDNHEENSVGFLYGEFK
jgi:SAM-dependent methyltransferase